MDAETAKQLDKVVNRPKGAEILKIHSILGISDKRAAEISKEVLDEMNANTYVAEGIEEAGRGHRLESYEETIFRGMCLNIAVDMYRNLAAASMN